MGVLWQRLCGQPPVKPEKQDLDQAPNELLVHSNK